MTDSSFAHRRDHGPVARFEAGGRVRGAAPPLLVEEVEGDHADTAARQAPREGGHERVGLRRAGAVGEDERRLVGNGRSGRRRPRVGGVVERADGLAGRESDGEGRGHQVSPPRNRPASVRKSSVHSWPPSKTSGVTGAPALSR